MVADGSSRASDYQAVDDEGGRGGRVRCERQSVDRRRKGVKDRTNQAARLVL